MPDIVTPHHPRFNEVREAMVSAGIDPSTVPFGGVIIDGNTVTIDRYTGEQCPSCGHYPAATNAHTLALA